MPPTVDECSREPPMNSPSNQRPKACPPYLVASVQRSRLELTSRQPVHPHGQHLFCLAFLALEFS